ncbi:unnamed protein product [Closterium sp. Yama58-4]|nr:unnamed protein product [Closterium sp. Yama58-4]
MTPKRLLVRFRNKLVLVFGDSVSKNFAGSVACVLHAASPGTIQDFRVANGNTKAYGVRNSPNIYPPPILVPSPKPPLPPPPLPISLAGNPIQVPSTNTRFASVFSNWLNQASGLGGNMNRVDLDKIDRQITDLLPLADIVVFQATNWWFPAINKWYVGGKEQSLSKEAAYEIGLKTLRDYVVKSGFKGRAALLGVSPSHYKVPGLKEGSCETSKMLTAQQAEEFAKGDNTGKKFREIQMRVLSGTPIRYVDVAPMSNYRPDGHVQKWMVKGGAPAGKKNDCLHWCEDGTARDTKMTAYWRNLLTLSLVALLFFAIAERSPPVALAYSSFKKKLTPIPFPNATDPDPPKPWTCDVSSGSWAPAPNLPLYTGLTCPYIRSGHNCQSAGRSDMSYQKLRWRPWGCKVVQLTPQRLLNLFRNKTVVVFGDSVSKDLSTSLRCMLHAASPNFSRFKLAGGQTRVWGEKVEPQNIRIVSLFSSHLNGIGFIPDASQPPAAAAAAGVGVGAGANGGASVASYAAAASATGREEAKSEAARAVATEAAIARATTMAAADAAEAASSPVSRAVAAAAAATPGEAGEYSAAAVRAAGGTSSGKIPGRVSPQAQQQARRVFLDQIDPKIKDLLPKADIVIFQATNWWYAEDNQWFLGGKQQKISRNAAYAIGMATLRDHVVRSGFQGKVVVMGVSPSHYIVPVPGVKRGKCDINSRLDWNQTMEVRRMDSRSFEMRKVQLQVLRGSRLRYVDVLPMSFWRPDGHLSKWTVPGGGTGKQDCLHWCEAGVTDAWLEMLYNTLLY